MDISDTPYYQKLIASSKLIGETIAPSLDVVNAMQPAIEQAKKLIAIQDTFIASQAILNDSLIQIVEKRNKSIANMIPPSLFAIQKQLESPSFNIAKKWQLLCQNLIFLISLKSQKDLPLTCLSTTSE